jgi:hypothetical protein
MEPNWLSPRDDRAWRGFMHAHHQLGVHLTRTEPGRAGGGHGLRLYFPFVRSSQGCMPITSARLRCSATPAGSVR